MAEEGSAARVVKNTLANGLGSFTTVAISLVLTPFLISGLGVEAYGVWTLALTLTFAGGYAGLSELGIEAAAVRYIAEARSDGDIAAVNRVASTAMMFFAGVGIVATAILVAISPLLTDAFGVDKSLHHDATLCFALVGGQLIFELPARAFFAVLEGSQRFVAYQGIELTRAAVQTVLFSAVLIADLGLVAMGGALAISSLAVFLMAWRLAHRTLPELRVRPAAASKAIFRRLATFGTGLFSLRVMGTFYRQMDRIIIGVALGPKFVTPYEIANKVHSGAAMVQSIAVSALVPAAAYARAKGEVLRDMFLRGTCYTVAVSVPVVIAAIVLAGPLIRTWIGGDVANEAVGATRLFLIYLLFVSLNVVGITMLVGLGNIGPVVLVSAVILVFNLGLSIALVGPLGIDGVIYGTLISFALGWPLQLRIFLKRLEIGVRHWARETVVPNLPGLAVQSVTAAPLLVLANKATNLAEVAALFLVSVASSLAGFLALGLRGERRRVLLKTLREAVRPRTRPPETQQPV